ERDGRVVIRAELPEPVAEASRTAVQSMFLAGLALELIGDAVDGETAIGDPVGEAPGHRSEMRRIGDVVAQSIEPERDPLRASGTRDDKFAKHGAPSENFRARP